MNMTNSNPPEKISKNEKFIPYKLLEQIIKETNIPKKIIEEKESELWYETLDGIGNLYFINNMTFFGNVKNGILQSTDKVKECTIIFKDGTKYEGEIHENKLTGKGKFIFPTQAIYTGEVLNGFRNGYGIYSSPNGIIYEGEWIKGLKHGKGKFTSKTMNYDGHWYKGFIEGEGKIKWENGNIYEGQFKSNNINGNGYMIWHDKKEKYSGEWINNKQNGKGIHIWWEPKGDTALFRNKYVGEWNMGRRNGYGIFYYSNGNKYEGFWENNYKNGFGVFTFEDGTKYIGRFENDRLIDISNQINEDNIDDIIEKSKEFPNIPIHSPTINTVKTTKAIIDSNLTNNKKNSIFKMNENKNKVNEDNKGNNNKLAEISNKIYESSSIKDFIIQKMDKGNNDLLMSPSKKSLNRFKPKFDLRDLMSFDPMIICDDFLEIENILLRYYGEIKHLYQGILARKKAEETDEELKKVKLFFHPINRTTSRKMSRIGIKKKKTEMFKEKPKAIKVLLTNSISESVKTPDTVFCVYFYDLWNFLREYGLINKDLTLVNFNRIFHSGKSTLFNYNDIPDIINSPKDIYNFISQTIEEQKNEFIILYKNFINYYYNNSSKPENLIKAEETKNLKVKVKHSLHLSYNIVLPRIFNEVLIRIAFLKFRNENIPLSQKLKKLLSILIPVKKKKRGSLASKSLLEMSFANHQPTHQEMMIKGEERKLINIFISEFQNILHNMFHIIAIKYKGKFYDQSDLTITHHYFFYNIIKKSTTLCKLFNKKGTYIDIISHFTKGKNDEDFKFNNVKYYNYLSDFLDNEFMEFEFYEIIYLIAKLYLTASKKEGLKQDYLQFLDKFNRDIKKDNKPERTTKQIYFFPYLKQHKKKEDVVRDKKKKEELEKERQIEIARFSKERKTFSNEDQNAFIEEVNESVESDDYDD